MKLPRRARACCTCKKQFEAGNLYISQMRGDARADFCPACWHGEGEFWQGKLPPKRERTSDTRALALFRQEARWRPLLALYLERRKELALRPTLSKGDKKCYELLETGELFEVPRQEIDVEAMQEVSHLLESTISR